MEKVNYSIRRTFTLDADTVRRLDYLCVSTGNTQSYIVRRGIQMYFDWLNSPDGKKAIEYLSGAGAAPQIGGKAQDAP